MSAISTSTIHDLAYEHGIDVDPATAPAGLFDRLAAEHRAASLVDPYAAASARGAEHDDLDQLLDPNDEDLRDQADELAAIRAELAELDQAA
jgi:hypothetical protein